MIVWERLMAGLLLIGLSPVFLITAGIIAIFSGRPVFFCQKRVGFKGKIFTIYKFRTMVIGAEELKKDLWKLNEADGPVFKIRNDPRFTRIGKFLCHSGIDELPQLFNVVKGDMSFIGPRPLPMAEAQKIPVVYRGKRQSVRPGMVSTWVLNGHHDLTFEEWMKEDINYIKNRNSLMYIDIFWRSAIHFIRLIVTSIDF